MTQTILARLADRVLGNAAVAATLFAPLVIAVGLATDHSRSPGGGLPARGGLQANLAPAAIGLRSTL